jgi:mannose/cellobiose epimerase-like protein (N-acyl-D-glucosamine 2-epimerase family)
MDADPLYEDWYRRIWNFCSTYFIDHAKGGWRPQINDALTATTDPFFGKPDLYHALQACLIPLLPTSGSVIHGLQMEGIKI